MNTILTQWQRLTALVCVVLTAFGCQQNDDAVATPKTITDLVLEDSQFSLLRAAVQYAEAGDALKAGNLTLFAPNDAAFQASGLTEAAIRSLPKEQVRTLVMYHVLASPVSSTAVPPGQNSVQMASRGVAYLNRTNSGGLGNTTALLFINNAQITRPDLVATNGYVHVIDRVLTPSAGSLLESIQANPNLTFLAAAIRRIGEPTTLPFLTRASSTSTFTLFAPNDAAFRADSRFGSLAAIEAANPQTLANALLYHTVSGVVFSNQLQTGTVATLLTNTRLTLTVTTNQISVKGNRNATAATIRTPDLVATNGVLHIVDQVLIP
ncbi:fasciclin domain-containing protein [Spirosoma montaniterrae]|uniref:Beta-Ig-H3/fasciclin n=1 Tax=Spirosoma montaniterrae TaxID=1178516 RepID=A0A1P9X1Z5_9BACT|nr:fasciclin domain-containing protein [Spirosoma montaniterrae]AQG81641.1 beta-Ig-H3/fasciclin [Spirosoma montaniterrae]